MRARRFKRRVKEVLCEVTEEAGASATCDPVTTTEESASLGVPAPVGVMARGGIVGAGTPTTTTTTTTTTPTAAMTTATTASVGTQTDETRPVARPAAPAWTPHYGFNWGQFSSARIQRFCCACGRFTVHREKEYDPEGQRMCTACGEWTRH